MPLMLRKWETACESNSRRPAGDMIEPGGKRESAHVRTETGLLVVVKACVGLSQRFFWAQSMPVLALVKACFDLNQDLLWP